MISRNILFALVAVNLTGLVYCNFGGLILKTGGKKNKKGDMIVMGGGSKCGGGSVVKTGDKKKGDLILLSGGSNCDTKHVEHIPAPSYPHYIPMPYPVHVRVKEPVPYPVPIRMREPVPYPVRIRESVPVPYPVLVRQPLPFPVPVPVLQPPSPSAPPTVHHHQTNHYHHNYHKKYPYTIGYYMNRYRNPYQSSYQNNYQSVQAPPPYSTNPSNNGYTAPGTYNYGDETNSGPSSSSSSSDASDTEYPTPDYTTSAAAEPVSTTTLAPTGYAAALNRGYDVSDLK